MSQKGIPLTKWPKLAAKMNQLLVGYPPVQRIFFPWDSLKIPTLKGSNLINPACNAGKRLRFFIWTLIRVQFLKAMRSYTQILNQIVFSTKNQKKTMISSVRKNNLNRFTELNWIKIFAFNCSTALRLVPAWISCLAFYAELFKLNPDEIIMFKK